MKTNLKTKPIYTHEGAKAKHINPEQQLRRSVLSCLLFEKEFYEDGECIAQRILNTADKLSFDVVANLAIEARKSHGLRHVPLLLLLALCKKKGETAKVIEKVISRPDELAELVALYWKDGKKPLPRQMKVGLAKAFNKFSEYQFAKWNRDNAIKLRDVMFMVHPNPKDEEQEAIFKKLAEKQLSPPDTWEVRLSGGEDKKTVFEDLLKRGKLGYIALLKNLRNMLESNVDTDLIGSALQHNKSQGVLPYQFVAAAEYGGARLEPVIEKAMLKNIEERPKIMGKTVLVVDVSYSMQEKLSGKSQMKRLDAACGLAILLASQCDDLRVFTFSQHVVEVAPRQGFALRDAVIRSQPHHCTYLGQTVRVIDQNCEYERLIVITDEQSQDSVADPKGKAYMINVASAKNGVGYGPWTHIDGFSQSVVDYIQEVEFANH